MASVPWRQAAVGAAVLLLAACGGRQSPNSGAPAQMAASSSTVTALEIAEIQPGAGVAIAAGQKALVEYTGWLYETSATDRKGKQFDSSLNSGRPFGFIVGTGQVIKGWDQGVLGMKVGGRRILTIPSELAYGDVGAGGVIPPGATLIFDVRLVAIE